MDMQSHREICMELCCIIMYYNGIYFCYNAINITYLKISGWLRGQAGVDGRRLGGRHVTLTVGGRESEIRQYPLKNWKFKSPSKKAKKWDLENVG